MFIVTNWIILEVMLVTFHMHGVIYTNSILFDIMHNYVTHMIWVSQVNRFIVLLLIHVGYVWYSVHSFVDFVQVQYINGFRILHDARSDILLFSRSNSILLITQYLCIISRIL